MSLPFLQSFGLSETESVLYELLLNLGESPAWVIVKESRLKRPTVYKALGNLEKKGLVSSRDKGKIIHFTPAPPTELLSLAEDRYTSLQRAKHDLQSVLPSLLSSYTTAVEKPVVQTFEGVEGLKKIYLDILEEGVEGYSILQTEDIEKELEEWLVTVFNKKRAKKKIPLKVIISEGKSARQFIKRDPTEYRFSATIPAEKFPVAHEVTIYGDKVAFLHYKRGERLIGSITKHPGFAQTMKTMFLLAWEAAEKYKTL